MLPRLPRLALVLALSCSIGLHWAFFQSVAWMGMVVSYSQNSNLTEALVMTFDGKHPCALCKEIARGKRSEKKSESQLEVKKLEFLAGRAQFIFSAPTHCWLPRVPDERLESVSFSPATPPPREVSA